MFSLGLKTWSSMQREITCTIGSIVDFQLMLLVFKFATANGCAVGGGIDDGADATQSFSPPQGSPGAAALAASPDDATGQSTGESSPASSESISWPWTAPYAQLWHILTLRIWGHRAKQSVFHSPVFTIMIMIIKGSNCLRSPELSSMSWIYSQPLLIWERCRICSNIIFLSPHPWQSWGVTHTVICENTKVVLYSDHKIDKARMRKNWRKEKQNKT